jgi:hypothetical protein
MLTVQISDFTYTPTICDFAIDYITTLFAINGTITLSSNSVLPSFIQ